MRGIRGRGGGYYSRGYSRGGGGYYSNRERNGPSEGGYQSSAAQAQMDLAKKIVDTFLQSQQQQGYHGPGKRDRDYYDGGSPYKRPRDFDRNRPSSSFHNSREDYGNREEFLRRRDDYRVREGHERRYDERRHYDRPRGDWREGGRFRSRGMRRGSGFRGRGGSRPRRASGPGMGSRYERTGLNAEGRAHEDHKPMSWSDEDWDDDEVAEQAEDDSKNGGDAAAADETPKEGEETPKPKAESQPDGDNKGKVFTTRTRHQCPHCSHRSSLVRDYIRHLTGHEHRVAMRRLAEKQKLEIMKLRNKQRQEQKKLEDEEKTKNLGEYEKAKPKFCTVCHLAFKEVGPVFHNRTDLHKSLYQYRFPRCFVCKMTFQTRMAYERHICTTGHMKRKKFLERKQRHSDKETADVGELNLDDFMIVDSVGTGEEDGDLSKTENGDVIEDDGKTATEKLAELPEYDGKQGVGFNHLHKLEVYHCNLCDIYIKITTKINQVILKHCMSRKHYDFYKKRLTENADKEKQLLEEKKKEEQAKASSQEGEGAVPDSGAEGGTGETFEKDITPVKDEPQGADADAQTKTEQELEEDLPEDDEEENDEEDAGEEVGDEEEMEGDEEEVEEEEEEVEEEAEIIDQ